MKPLRNQVHLRPDEKEAESAGGIILPDIAQAHPGFGVVLACGPDVRDLTAGDRVCYDHREVEWLEDGTCLLPERDIMVAIGDRDG